jgi:hypothetical protein
MQLAAKNLLGGLKEKLKEMRPAQMARFLVAERLTTIAKRSPVITLNLWKGHLRDTGFHIMMLRLRESATLFSAVQEFRRLTVRRKLDSYAAFTYMQRELLNSRALMLNGLSSASPRRLVLFRRNLPETDARRFATCSLYRESSCIGLVSRTRLAHGFEIKGY